MFQPFCFNHIITDLSFIYIYKNYKAGLIKFRAIAHILTRMQACKPLQKFLWARASEHSCNICEQRTHFTSTFKLNETIWYPSVLVYSFLLPRNEVSSQAHCCLKMKDSGVSVIPQGFAFIFSGEIRDFPFIFSGEKSQGKFPLQIKVTRSRSELFT